MVVQIKEEVESTELALAFLLGDSSLPGDIITQPQKQPVFAFLPLRSFGFRFIVQGELTRRTHHVINVIKTNMSHNEVNHA